MSKDKQKADAIHEILETNNGSHYDIADEAYDKGFEHGQSPTAPQEVQPGKNKPFIAANIREIMDQYPDSISFQRMVELFNEVADKFYNQPSPQSQGGAETDMTAREFFDGELSAYTLSFLNDDEKETLLEGIELYAKGKVHQYKLASQGITAEGEQERYGWEVLAYNNFDIVRGGGGIRQKEKDGLFYFTSGINTSSVKEWQLEDSWRIHSVRRAKDGAVFTLGDKIEIHKTIAPITSFQVRNEKTQLWCSINDNEGYGSCLSVAILAPKGMTAHAK